MTKKMTKRSSVEKLILKMLVCAFSFVIISFLVTMLGGKAFLISTTYQFPEWLSYIISYGLFFINLSFWFSISLDIYDKRILIVLALYIPIFIISITHDENSMVASTLLPLMYIVFMGIKLNRAKRTIIQSTVFLGLTALYQGLSLLAKTSYFYLGYTDTGTSILATLSIDLILFYYIIFLYGRCIYYGKRPNQTQWTSRQHTIFPASFKAPSYDNEDCQAIAEFNALTGFQAFKAILLLTSFQLAQMLLVLVLCIVGGVWVECLLILTAYFFATSVIKRRWHSNSIFVCTVVTAFIFYSASRIALPLNISILACMIEGFLLTYMLYRVDVIATDYKEAKEKLNESEKENPP